jgi:hypothetical protein
MKKLFLLFAMALLFALHVSANKFTVNNNGSNTAQFTTIQDAVDSAANGDTIFVEGSPNVYASFTISDKKVIIIGPGWYPEKNNPLTATVAGFGIYNNTTVTGSSSGSEIIGLVISNSAGITSNGSNQTGTSNLKITRCYFYSIISISNNLSNSVFESCIFNHALLFNSSQTYSNLLFQNCVFKKNTYYFTNACIADIQNGTNILFDHNLFYSNHGATAFSNCDFLTISNNIFVEMDLVNTAASSISFSTFNNNITYNCGGAHDTVWAYNNNTGVGNIPATDPQLADSAAVNNGTFSETLDFSVLGGLANNGGSDGKDIGLLFDTTGALNWNNAHNSRFPRITVMNITTPTIAPGGNVSVSVEAKVSQ